MHPLGFSVIDNNINEGMTTIEEKKQSRDKGTRKNRSNKRVSNMIDMINNGLNTSEEASDDNDELGEFNPPPVPVSGTESSPSANDSNMGYPTGAVHPPDLPSGGGKGTARPYAPQASQQTDSSVAPEAFSDLQSNYAQQYYNQWTPSYNRMSDPATPNNELLQKLDHVIHLLEAEQDEKTGHVTEEIILYTFLGVFMIFIVDSFARAGKYVR